MTDTPEHNDVAKPEANDRTTAATPDTSTTTPAPEASADPVTGQTPSSRDATEKRDQIADSPAKTAAPTGDTPAGEPSQETETNREETTSPPPAVAEAGTPPPPPSLPPESPTAGGDAGDMKEAPLLEHLAELRTRLVRCLIAVGVGFAGCYAFAEKLLGILLKPLTDVLPQGHSLIATSLPETFFTVMRISSI